MIPYYCVSCFVVFIFTLLHVHNVFFILFFHTSYTCTIHCLIILNQSTTLFFITWVILYPMTVVCNRFIKVFIIHYSGLPVGAINLTSLYLTALVSGICVLHHYLVQYSNHNTEGRRNTTWSYLSTIKVSVPRLSRSLPTLITIITYYAIRCLYQWWEYHLKRFM